MFKSSKNLFLIVMGIAMLNAGCGAYTGDDYPTVTKTFSMNGTKLISAEIDNPLDPSTFTQQTYLLNPTRRLLLRFEELSNHVKDVDLNYKRKIMLAITLTEPKQMDEALKALKVCPLTSPWMMKATWKKPQPRLNWNADGGDIDIGGCIKGSNIFPQEEVPPKTTTRYTYNLATGKTEKIIEKDVEKTADNSKAAPSASPSPSPSPTPTLTAANPPSMTTIYFDLTDWFVNYPQARNLNYGNVLISDRNVTIYGDGSGSFSPRMIWKEKF